MFDLLDKYDEYKTKKEKRKQEQTVSQEISFIPNLKEYDLITMQRIIDLEIEKRKCEIKLAKIN